ncbi:MAG: hypothetical protein JSR26_03940 [Proteobacteria bacterium]|nr:hypothetical protein [Pseudomonadota bacterium]
MASAGYGSLPFAEQIAFFRRKFNLPTETWTDILHEAHDHAFVVAGANRMDLLADFREAIDAAIANGETLEQFRTRFDRIVAQYGWDYNGGRNWRSRVIYETNMRQSYNAGRYAQLQELKKVRPFWRYKHADGEKYPRPLHLAWNNLVLSADDPWWDTHFPANGWGCKCYVEALNERDLKRMGKDGPDQAPPLDMQTVTIGQRGPTPRTIDTPAGVDPGFGYTPGRDAWFKQQAEAALNEAKAQHAVRWEAIDAHTAAELGRPAMPPVFPLPEALGPRLENPADVIAAIKEALGGFYTVHDVHGLPTAIDATVVGLHIAKNAGRTRYIPLMADLLADPWEVWTILQRNPETDALRIRARLIKVYDVGNGRGVLLVCDFQRGQFVGWTFLPMRRMRDVQAQREGLLWFGAN